MHSIKLTKTELRFQERRLTQLKRYLPTLKLKKSLLQIEVNQALMELEALLQKWEQARKKLLSFAGLFLEKVDINLFELSQVVQVEKTYENIAGVEIPIFEKVVFQPNDTFLFDTPIWADSALAYTQEAMQIRERIYVAKERLRALEKELREVSIRVNLFEKVLIPRAQENIKKIRIFLGDQFLTAVAQSKVAKEKILMKRRSVE